MKRGFTLLEVCLAVTVMSAGVLSVVILYSMGFRETKQSREDVGSAAYADAVMSPLVNALSATNVAWSAFNSLENYPSDDGWGEYLDGTTGQVNGSPDARAKTVFSTVAGKLPNSPSWPSSVPSGLKAGLIVMHEEDSSVVKIAFRATRNPSMLMSAPMYYTEVHFQGDPEK